MGRYPERPFGTLQWEVLNFLPGYCASRPGELNGYDGHKKAQLAPDRLYGILARYFIDECPYRPHQGTGMFGATPRQKFDEVIELSDGIDAPNSEEMRFNLGASKELTTTSEGVKMFGIPFNSSELQRFAGGEPKRVTVFLNPDNLRKVSITTREIPGIITADLQLTVFADLSLQETLAVKNKAIEDNPGQRVLHIDQLKRALKRRVEETNFFPDSRCPDSYLRIEELHRQADQMANVEIIKLSRSSPTTSHDDIIGSSPDERLDRPVPHRPGSNHSFQAAQSVETLNDDDETDPDTVADAQAPMFGPIKKSKL